MPSQQPLMRPLRSDSLKPRPAAQASWEPQKREAPAEETPDPFLRHEASPADEKHVPAQEAREQQSLSAAIASILSVEEDDGDDDDGFAGQDAVPDRLIPEPVCVPLFDQPCPKRKRYGWLWLLLLAAAAGGLYAAWRCGYLSVILP